MPEDPKDSARPGRLIVPGEPEPADRPRIVLPGSDVAGAASPAPAAPDDAPAPRRASKIILPPGVAQEPPADLPEYPRLRALVLVPFSDGKRELVMVNDPLGVIPGQPVLGIEALGLLQLLDGTLSLTDIRAAVMQESKDLRVGNLVTDFVAQLDELLMLESPRFDRAYAALREEYHRLEIRPAALEDRSYPAEPAALAAFLDAHFAAAATRRPERGGAAPAAKSVPRAILAPHLDPRRAGATMAEAYAEIAADADEPLRFVVFGTGHSLLGDLAAPTRKHFETPLGKVPCDTVFVDRVAAAMGPAAWHGELAHREEHSIEFQVVYLRHRFRDRRISIVPILCGGFHALLDDGRTPRDEPAFEAMIGAVREAERALGGTTVYVAGVDFSHVGPRFGDPAVDDPARAEIEKIDRAALDAAARGDADAWFESIAAHDDSTRICGFAPTYALLRCAGVRDGRLLRYEHSDEPDGSTVTVAAMAWD